MKNVKNRHARPRVLIDPGHYGSKYNPGAAAGYYESKAMWALSLFEQAALKAYGIDADLTRSNIKDNPELTARGKKAKDYDLAYSNHSNGGNGKATYSLGIYFAADNCEVDQPSKEFARMMSGVVADTMPTCSSARIWTRSSDYDRDRDGYKDDWYGFLRGAHSVDTAAAIIEHGFHDHAATASWLLLEDNLKKLAEAKAAKIAEWFDVTKNNANTSAPTTTTKKEGTPVNMATLKPGSKHPHVKVMQMLLIGNGYSCGSDGPDGIYGSATKKAVGAYQEDHKDTDGKPLGVDYICGPKMWGSLLKQ